MYAKIFADYMEANSTNIMFFEPGQVPDQVTALVRSVGFKTPPGGRIGSANHVLNDHTYCCSLGFNACPNGEPDPNKGEKCDAVHSKKLRKRSNDAKNLGIPLFISEFGACLDSDVCVREIN